jgi:hypothetical protein
MEGVEHTTRQVTRAIDLSGLPEDAVRVVETLVSALREDATKQPAIPGFDSRDEWVKAIREWAGSHIAKGSEADWSRESIYAGREMNVLLDTNIPGRMAEAGHPQERSYAQPAPQ